MYTYSKNISTFIFVSTFFCCCTDQTQSAKNIYPENPDYHFNAPDKIWELPNTLKEISGIVSLNDSIMLCQQDEKGYLYFYNLKNKQIEQKIKFAYDADFEDIAIANNTIYILRSNGWIYAIEDINNIKNPVIYKTGLMIKNDTEGLCYDSLTNSLLIACKNQTGLKNSGKNDKAVFAFDLTTKKLSTEPLLIFSMKYFSPSAISIHPSTKHIFILSASKKKILEFNSNGTILFENNLKHSQFKQPEGLTFTKNGDLYISNEGKSGKANILFFRNTK